MEFFFKKKQNTEPKNKGGCESVIRESIHILYMTKSTVMEENISLYVSIPETNALFVLQVN